MCRQVKTDPELSDIFVVILSSALTSEYEQIAGLTSGADGHISRPIGNKELVTRVEAYVRILQHKPGPADANANTSK